MLVRLSIVAAVLYVFFAVLCGCATTRLSADWYAEREDYGFTLTLTATLKE